MLQRAQLIPPLADWSAGAGSVSGRIEAPGSFGGAGLAVGEHRVDGAKQLSGLGVDLLAVPVRVGDPDSRDGEFHRELVRWSGRAGRRHLELGPSTAGWARTARP